MDHLGLKADAIQVLLHPLEAVVVGIDGNHAGQGRLALQQMGGFAAGGGAGVQHPLARLGIEQGGGLLGGTVLHRAVTLLEAGQLGHVAGALQQDAIFPFHPAIAGMPASLMRASMASRLWRWLLLRIHMGGRWLLASMMNSQSSG